jgi:hypothetical protein
VRWLPAIASVQVSDQRQAFALVKEFAGRNLKDTRPAEPGHCLQIPGSEKETSESLEHALDRHPVEMSPKMGGKSALWPP